MDPPGAGDASGYECAGKNSGSLEKEQLLLTVLPSFFKSRKKEAKRKCLLGLELWLKYGQILGSTLKNKQNRQARLQTRTLQSAGRYNARSEALKNSLMGWQLKRFLLSQAKTAVRSESTYLFPHHSQGGESEIQGGSALGLPWQHRRRWGIRAERTGLCHLFLPVPSGTP